MSHLSNVPFRFAAKENVAGAGAFEDGDAEELEVGDTGELLRREARDFAPLIRARLVQLFGVRRHVAHEQPSLRNVTTLSHPCGDNFHISKLLGAVTCCLRVKAGTGLMN